MNPLDGVRFDSSGLVPVVAQDAESGEVLMVAWANSEALEETKRTGDLTFFSRSRNRLWKKGETSGNTMRVVEMKIDCDGDTLLALVEPAGPACHTGERTCFFRSLWGEGGTDCTFWDNSGDLFCGGAMRPLMRAIRPDCSLKALRASLRRLAKRGLKPPLLSLFGIGIRLVTRRRTFCIICWWP